MINIFDLAIRRTCVRTNLWHFNDSVKLWTYYLSADKCKREIMTSIQNNAHSWHFVYWWIESGFLVYFDCWLPVPEWEALQTETYHRPKYMPSSYIKYPQGANEYTYYLVFNKNQLNYLTVPRSFCFISHGTSAIVAYSFMYILYSLCFMYYLVILFNAEYILGMQNIFWESSRIACPTYTDVDWFAHLPTFVPMTVHW